MFSQKKQIAAYMALWKNRHEPASGKSYSPAFVLQGSYAAVEIIYEHDKLTDGIYYHWT